MGLTVKVHSRNEAGEQFEIALEKLSLDKGLIRVKSWNSDQDPETDTPAKDDIVKLYEIRSMSKTVISCKGDVFGPDPVLKCSLLAGAPPAGPSVQVEITGSLFGSFDGTKAYPLAADDVTKLKKFLSDAAFPAA
jgi:hypothetical protein